MHNDYDHHNVNVGNDNDDDDIYTATSILTVVAAAPYSLHNVYYNVYRAICAGFVVCQESEYSSYTNVVC